LTTADDFALQLALERGLVAAEAVESAQRTAAEQSDGNVAPDGVIETLCASGALDRRALAEALAQRLGMPFVVIGERQIPGDVLGTVPRSFAIHHGVCPIAREDGAVHVALSDPLAADVLDALAHVCAQRAVPVVAATDDLQRAIARHYGHEADALEFLSSGAGESRDPSIESAGAGRDLPESDAPIIRLVQTIIRDRKSTRLNSSHNSESRMPSSA
jgi:general secretion pathway protein E/type IV pilus assembly protein PilB